MARLKGAFALEGVYLFGSWARGTADRRSDLDLLVVARTDLPPLERIGRVLELLQDSPRRVLKEAGAYMSAEERRLEARGERLGTG